MLTHDETRLDHIFAAAQKHGEAVYSAAVYLSQRSDIHTEQLNTWVEFLDNLPNDVWMRLKKPPSFYYPALRA